MKEKGGEEKKGRGRSRKSRHSSRKRLSSSSTASTSSSSSSSSSSESDSESESESSKEEEKEKQAKEVLEGNKHIKPIPKTVRDLELALTANWRTISTETEALFDKPRQQLENRSGVEVAVMTL